MKIRKFYDFINEELNDTPETYINSLLTKLKRDVDRMFNYESSKESDDVREKTPRQAKADFKDKSKMSFEDLGLRLESNDISKYSALYDSLTIKFSDDANTYTLIIMIDLKEALPKDDSDFKVDDIKKCYVKFKKYDINTFDIIGQISKNVDIKKIDENFIIDLKRKLF
jgi:hypothetical protein